MIEATTSPVGVAGPGPTDAGEEKRPKDRSRWTQQSLCTGAASGALGTELSHIWVQRGLPQKLGLGMHQIRNMVGTPLEKEGVLG